MATRQEWINMWLFGLRQLQEQATKSIDDDWPEGFRVLVASVGTALVAYDRREAGSKEALTSVLDRLHAVAMASKAEREGTASHVGSMLPIVDESPERTRHVDDEEERTRRARADTADFAAVVAEVLVESLTSGETSSLGGAETNSDSGADTSPSYDDSPSYGSPSYEGGGGDYGGGGASGSWSDD